ncbi:5884_t:CDS:2, partial [Entrophospora sp. SA101]
ISAKEVGQGVIYVDIPANIMQLGEAIGKAINFSFEEDISFTAQLLRKILGDTSKKIDYPEWVRALDAFKHASIIYKKKYGKPPIIVYDNISQLVYKNPEILDILQDDAKNNADDRKYIAVFVSSEGSVPRRMESRSSWSRAKKPVMEIGDLSEKESMDYLVNKRKISSSEANKIYELVGGRIVELKAVADDFLDGKSFKVIKWQILTEVEKKFKNAQLYENQPYHEVGKRVINSLLKSKELSYITYMKFFNRAEESDKMLEYNVFAYHPEKNTVTFQSHDSNAPSVSDSNTNNTNNSTSFKQKSSRPKSSKTNRKNKKDSFDNLTTYNPSLEDDDYNVDNGRHWENLSREKLEEDRENDYNGMINP